MKFLPVLIAAACSVLSAGAQSLLVTPPLSGSVETAVWSNLSQVNTVNVPDTNPRQQKSFPDNLFDPSVEFRVIAPGYGATQGLYSWTGTYRTTVSKTTTSFAIKQAVFQLDLVWDPATGFPHNNGPRLSYNGGNQNLAPLPMILGGSRQVENNTGVEQMEGISHFVYRGVMWQWDLSDVEVDINSISISMHYANHTSVVRSRVDVASEFNEIGGNTASPLELWRDNYFQTTANSGNAADNADPDGDGITNLIEYALGTRPDSAIGEHGNANLPALSSPAGYLQLSFMIPSTPPSELTYRVRSSSNLVDWKLLATKVGAGAWVWNGDGASRITSEPSIERQPFIIGDDSATSGHSRRFMRLEISR